MADMGYKSPYNDKLYLRGSQDLAGYGNPPNCPDYQKENPGAGSVHLNECRVDVAQDGKLLESDV